MGDMCIQQEPSFLYDNVEQLNLTYTKLYFHLHL